MLSLMSTILNLPPICCCIFHFFSFLTFGSPPFLLPPFHCLSFHSPPLPPLSLFLYPCDMYLSTFLNLFLHFIVSLLIPLTFACPPSPYVLSLSFLYLFFSFLSACLVCVIHRFSSSVVFFPNCFKTEDMIYASFPDLKLPLHRQLLSQSLCELYTFPAYIFPVIFVQYFLHCSLVLC